MKTSLAHLPAVKREDLKRLTEAILKDVQGCEMIILFGSYARGDYVEVDYRFEFGVFTTFQSDYDIFVLTTKDLSEHKGGVIENKLDRIKRRHEHVPYHTPVEFLHMGIETMNKYLSEGRYFYTDIKSEGIVLYNSKNFVLARRRKLYYSEIQKMAQEYYTEWHYRGSEFYDGAIFYHKRNNCRMASFMLHQACECLMSAIILVFTLDKRKNHNLDKLIKSTKKYTAEVFYVFRRSTEEERRLFNILKRAYVEARYNPEFDVTTKDIESLYPTVKRLMEVAETICQARIKYYEERKGELSPLAKISGTSTKKKRLLEHNSV